LDEARKALLIAAASLRAVNQRSPALGNRVQHVAKKRGGAHILPQSRQPVPK
jgi:hypothetical protein